MTAGLLGRTPSERPTTSASSNVDNVVTADRLAQLTPLHRRAALRQAQANAGLSGALPTLDDLRTAERPAAEVWRLDSVSYASRPKPAAVVRETAVILADLKWRAALPHMPRSDRERLARGIAERRLTPDMHHPPTSTSTMLNRVEVERARALAVSHGPLLTALGTVLDGLDRHVRGVGLAAADEDAIRALADQQAVHAHAAWKWRAALAHRAGRPSPGLTPQDRRRQDPLWQRRQLRRTAGLARQHLAAALGTVGRGASPYADDYSLTCRRDRDDAARAWADAHVWQPPGGGAPVPMASIREGSDTARLHRLGAMAAGLDEVAERNGLDPIMITLTLPPEWHPSPKVGNRTWTAERGPEATDDALRHRWNLFRSRMAKSKVRLLGLRVWEPHRDGCPHAHALLYVRPEQVGEVDRHLMAVCPEPTPGRRVASTLVEIDRTRSRGSTYVMKYLRKTLTPSPTGADAVPGTGDDDHMSGDHHDRTRATASERGWRRYAALGVHGVQRPWQRVLTATDAEVAAAPVRVREARAALDEGRWADALESMGAVRRPGIGRLRLGYDSETVDLTTGEILPLVDRYGSSCRRAAWLLDTETPAWRLALGRRGAIERLAERSPDFNGVTVSDRYPRSEESEDAEGQGDDELGCTLSTRRIFAPPGDAPGSGTGPPDPGGPPPD